MHLIDMGVSTAGIKRKAHNMINRLYELDNILNQLMNSFTKMMNKGMSNNRAFYIDQVGRRIQELKTRTAIMAAEGQPWIMGFYNQVAPMEDLHSRILRKGWKNAKAECDKLEREVLFLRTWLEEHDDGPNGPVERKEGIREAQVEVYNAAPVMNYQDILKNLGNHNTLKDAPFPGEPPPKEPASPLTPEEIEAEYKRLGVKRPTPTVPS